MLSAVNLPDLSSLELLESLATPIWIFELDEHAIWWGNAAARTFWKATSVEELGARDFSSDSETVRRRLRQIAREPESRQGRQERWTLYPAKEPVTVSLNYQTITIREDSVALLIEVVGGHSSYMDARAARIAESVRYSGVIVSMFTMTGDLLVQNASAFDCYGPDGNTTDKLVNRFVDANVVASLLESVKASAVFDAELEVRTTQGQRTHRVKGHEGRDPVTGDVVVVLSEDDISDLIRLRRKLSDLNANLEQRVAERSALLEASQKQLLQAQKMEVIGQLTGGVAHDFNNLLAVILGNLELLRGEIEDQTIASSETNELIDSAIEAVTHGADLTNSMLAYARKARLAPTVVDLNQVVDTTERWMRRTIDANVEIETVLQASAWPICVDPSSLQSSLVNLILNARDAMKSGGTLTIETANVHIDDDFLKSRAETIQSGRYVMVSVADTGGGIESEIIEQIYDPFFTTKAVGKGSGLGLSMVDGFVRQSGGTIRVDSEPGQGTSFKLYFPAAVQESNADSTRGRVLPAVTHKHQARILLAEDKAELMAVLEKMLVAAGYSVTTAQNGDVAYSIFKADPSFDLVLTDIVMPGRLQGPDFAKECRALNATTPFIFLSGYAREVTVHSDGIRPDDIRLMKPVSKAELLRAIETCLKA